MAYNGKVDMMLHKPVEKLVCKLAIPTIISMLVTALYNMADTYFVGQIGGENTAASAGVGLIFPMMAIVQALGFFFGQGSGNFVSRALGAKKADEAAVMVSTANICALLLGVVFTGCGLIFRPLLLEILGAGENANISALTVTYARDYLTVILIGAPFLCVSCVLNNQLRFQGNAVFSMIGLVSGALLNCVLDPLLIFTCDLEVTGAALATTISQVFSCVLLYIGTLRSDSLKIRLRDFKPRLYYLKNIAVGGAPSLFRQGLASIASLCLNRAAGSAAAAEFIRLGMNGSEKEFCDAVISAFTIVGKVMMFGFSALLGFGQGFQPVCGFNWGAGEYGRVKRAYLFSMKVGAVILLILSVLGFVFAGNVVALFRDNATTVEYGSYIMRMQCISFTLMAVVTLTNMLYQNIGRVAGATLLAVARQGLMFIPVVLLLPAILESSLWGVILAQPIADAFAFVLAVPLMIRILKEIDQREKGEPYHEIPDRK